MKTLIHETAHVLTLGHKQIPVDENYVKDFEEDKDISTYRNKCGTLFLQEGCAKENSYINQFYIILSGSLLSRSGQKRK